MGRTLLAEERRNRIIKEILDRKSVMVAELAEVFSVSEETVRRDLERLQDMGLLMRTFGGAVAVNDRSSDFPAKIRETMNTEAKTAIAHEAAKLVKNGEVIILDASSSAFFMAKALKGKRITVITNALNVVWELADEPGMNIVSTGGKLYPAHRAFFGLASETAMEQYRASKLFFSCKGISGDCRLTDSDEMISQSHRVMMERAEEKYLLCDSSKFGSASFMTTTGIEELDVLITERHPGQEWEEKITSSGVKIYIAENQEAL